MNGNDNFNYEFAVEVLENGKQRPFIKLGFNPNYKHLGNLALGSLSQSYGVKLAINGITRVNQSEIEEHTFAGDDWCIVIYKKDKSTIVNGFDEFEPFEMESTKIYKFLIDWYNFLTKYENGEIPGLKYSNK